MEPSTPVQVRPETVVAPQNPSFSAPISGYQKYSSPPTGSMFIKWNRSLADTQLNFKGYFVKLQPADTIGYYISHTYDIDSTLLDTLSIFHLPGRLTDTFCTFNSLIGSAPNSGITLGTYAVTVSSEKTSASDTVIKSADSSQYVGLFDPLPLQNPTNLQATSIRPTSILLRWTPSVTDKDTGFLQYVVYYRDTTLNNDTGHIAATVPKNTGQNMTPVSVPPYVASGSNAQEWPYQFWVKSERNDSVILYGPDLYGPDTNEIVWAGAEAVPHQDQDSGYNAGYAHILHTMYFGSLNGQWDVAEDSTDNLGQDSVIIVDSTVTLQVQGPDGLGFLTRVDNDSSLDSVFYTSPLDNSAQFTQNKSITLPRTATNGAIVYLMMNDDRQPLGNMWARILIHAQTNGTFVNPNGGGIDIKASFQPGVTKDGQHHLPFY